jgi:glycosyltransferase involved in cell wall biosynthesis
MNILLVAPMPPSPTGLAIPRVLHAQLVGLSERNHVTLAVVAGPEEPELEAVEQLRAAGVDVHAACRHEPRAFGERWRRRRRLAGGWLGSRSPWRTVWYREPGLQPILDGLLADRQFDVIAVEDSAAGVYRYGSSAATVYTEHEVRRPRRLQLPSGRPRSWARGLLGELDWGRWPAHQLSIWRRFDLIQAFTARDADAIRTLAPEIADRVRVNPFGIDLPDELPPAMATSREIVFMGNFTHPPNVDAALWLGSEIMPKLRSMAAGARLTLIGPWAPAAVQALACTDIRVAGAVPDLRPYLSSAAVVLAPIRIGGGMRMKVLEALALGKAVVTTSRGAEGLEHDGGPPLAVADTADEIASETARLLADAGGRRALGERARAFVAEHHSPRAYAARLEQAYDEARERFREKSSERRLPS